MTLSAGQVSLGVSPDTRGFGQKLHDGIMGEAGGFGGIGGKIAGLIAGGIAAVGIGESIKKVFETGFDEAKDAAAGTAQLTAGIQSTGNAANVSVEGLNNLASSIQGYSGQTDDSIVKSEQLLLTFTNIKNNGPDKIFDQATKASADMAAKFGGDASSQAVLLGKALNDPVKGITALTRVGVSFTAQQKSTIDAMVKTGDVAGAQKVILKELNTEFGGAAKAAGESFPGELQRAHRAFEDLSQGIVEKFLPIFSPAIEFVIGLMQKITPAIGDAAQSVSDKAAKIGGAIQGVYDLLIKGDFTKGFREAFHVEEDSPIVGMILKVHDGLGFASEALDVFRDGLKTGMNDVGDDSFLDKVGKFGNLANHAFKEAQDAFDVFFDGLKTGQNEVGDGSLLDSVGKIGNSIHAMFVSVGPLIPQIVSLAMAFSPLHIIITALGPLLPVLAQAVASLASSIVTGLANALLAVLPTLTQMTGAIVSGLVPAITGLVHWISQNMDLVKTLAVMVLGAVAAFKIYEGVMGVVQIATKAWAAVQAILNIVLDANPIMLIIIAIGALVAGIIWIATQTHFFQDVWKVMTDAIGAAWNWLWSSVISPVVNFMVTAFQNVGKAVSAFWSQHIQPTVNAIGAVFKWLWDSILWPITEIWILSFTLLGLGAMWLWSNAIMPAINAIGAIFMWLWANVISPVINAIGAAFNWIWANVISPVVNFIVAYFQMLGAVASWLWNNAISPAINAIGAAFNWIWNNVIAPIGQWIGGAIQTIGDTVSNVFGAIGGTIRGAFDGVVGFIRGVINSVIDVINGVIGKINGLAGAVKDATGGAINIHLDEIPHLATGGTIRTPGAALVGENGPEIVSLPAGATVYPTGTGPGTSGGTTFNIYEAHNATAIAQTVTQRLTARKV